MKTAIITVVLALFAIKFLCAGSKSGMCDGRLHESIEIRK